MLTVKDAKKLLKEAPNDSSKCRINPSLTTANFYDIMSECLSNHEKL